MSTDPHRFDVFLSYHWQDHEAVERLAHTLRSNQLRPFLDRWYLRPGLPWPEKLEKVIATCDAMAVFLGPGEMGSWQKREVYLAMNRQAQDKGFPVIPVLLPGSDVAPGFLSLNTWVDLRQGPQSEPHIKTLIGAIRGEPSVPDALEETSAAKSSACPYRGLRYFREEDAPFFFGRDMHSSALYDLVQRRSLVAVVGASGSGKSSLARAGLAPRLRRSLDGKVWEIAAFFPESRPLHALSAALTSLLEPQLTEVSRLQETNKLAAALLDPGSGIGVSECVARILEKQPGTDSFLLIVDQWEELYTLTKEDPERQRFIAELLRAANNKRIRIVLTLRGDFYGQLLEHRELSDKLQEAVLNLPPMNDAEIRQIIVGPAAKLGFDFEPGLVEEILDAVREQPGSLPLTEFVLERLWRERRGTRLVHESYAAMRGVRGALASKAEQIFLALSEGERKAVQRLFLQLVRPGTGTEDTRRRAALSEIAGDARRLVKQLTDERLLVTGRDAATGSETVEVSHEALIRHWDTLRGWIDAEREFLLWRERLRSNLGSWLLTDRDDGALLRGALLGEAERWLTRYGEQLTPDERALIEASRSQSEWLWHDEQERQLKEMEYEKRLADADQRRTREGDARRIAEAEKIRAAEAALHVEQRRVRNMKWLLAFMSIAAVSGAVFAGIVFWLRLQPGG